ncbi:MAG: cyclase family protein [Gemmatimonadota bacterium]|nr:cyclase family protein [Gemmatimonadota bacterium]
MRVFVRVGCLLFLVSACRPTPDIAAVFDGRGGSWVDLTHAFSSESVYWPTAEGFTLEQVAYGPTDGGYFYAANNFSAAEHGGTHLDAPIHFAAERHTTDAIPVEQLIGPAVVVDVSDRASPDYLIGVSDLERWESQHGKMPEGAILLLHTGWGRFYADRTRYLGTDVTGPEAVPLLHFPGLDPVAAAWLVAERGVAAVGIDTPSIDYGQSMTFASHVALYAANIPGFENVAHLEQVPATGAFVVALPMKIAGGSGGPLRIVAFVPTE